MSTIDDIKTGRGILTPLEEDQNYDFSHKGCECCNYKAGRNLGNDTSTFNHFINFKSEPVEFELCNQCAHNFTYNDDFEESEEPLDNYNYDKYY